MPGQKGRVCEIAFHLQLLRSLVTNTSQFKKTIPIFHTAHE